MKKLKQIVDQVKAYSTNQEKNIDSLLWQLICYSPKMPLRLSQEQLLAQSAKFNITVKDEYFTKKALTFNGFIWGEGKHKVLITHGWGSKAADFTEMISALKENKDLQIFAFDVPGNGSSEGELSNLLLFVEAVKTVVSNYGQPDIVIGHSLGAMANIISLKEMNFKPPLLISLAPLIRLKEHFIATMTSTGVSQANQNQFFKSFEEHFQRSAASFNLNNWYFFDKSFNHWLAYDTNDMVSPNIYLKEFLNAHPYIKSTNYDNAGHERIIKNEEVINAIKALIKEASQL